MARGNITELTDEQVVSRSKDRFFRKVYKETPSIPLAAYNGKYVCAVLVAVDSALSEAEMDTLEAGIDAVANVHKSFCLIGPARIPVDRVGAGNDLHIGVEAGFDIRPEPTP